MPPTTRSFISRSWDWMRGQEPLVLGCVLILAALGWVFIEVADEVVEGESMEVETAILRALRDPTDLTRPRGPRWWTDAVTEWTALGSWPILTLIVLSVAGYLFLIRRPITAGLVLGSVIGGTILCNVLKQVFDRPRPSLVPALTEHLNPSFPSGHALMAAVVYLTLGATLAGTAQRWRQKLYILGVATFLTILVGLTRVHLGVHYPTDVLAGWCIGAGWAIVCWLVVRSVRRRRPGLAQK